MQCVGGSDGRRDELTEPGRGYYRIYDMSGGGGGDFLVILLNNLMNFARFNFEYCVGEDCIGSHLKYKEGSIVLRDANALDLGSSGKPCGFKSHLAQTLS